MIHITSLSSPRKTACGKKCDGWKVPPLAGDVVKRHNVNCSPCKEAIFFKVKRGKR